MIIINEGEGVLSGSPITLISELAVVIESIRKDLIKHGIPEKEADNMIVTAGKLAYMSDEDIEAELENLVSEFAGML